MRIRSRGIRDPWGTIDGPNAQRFAQFGHFDAKRRNPVCGSMQTLSQYGISPLRVEMTESGQSAAFDTVC